MPTHQFYNLSAPLISEIPSFKESNVVSSNLIRFGQHNDFPQRVNDLIDSVSVLRSIIDGSSLVCSSLPTEEAPQVHLSKNFYYDLYYSLFGVGAAYLLIRRSVSHKELHISVMPARFVRTNTDYSKFFYADTDSDYRHRIEYESFIKNPDADSSVYPIFLSHSGRVYPLPLFNSALREIVTLRDISDYHASALANSFCPSAIITFCNGEPSAEDKDDIERRINKKFSGHGNASRLLLNFCDTPESAPKVEAFSTEDVSARYSDLRDHCLKAVFAAFRCTPSLFGIPDGASTALSDVEYAQQARLFYIFTVKPILQIVHRSLLPLGITVSVSNPFNSLDNE